jgi:hypothetical protein
MSNEGSWDGKGALNPPLCALAKSLDPTRLVMATDGMEEGGDATWAEIASMSTMHAVWSVYMERVARQTPLSFLRPCIDHEFLNVPTLYNPEEAGGYKGGITAPPAAYAERAAGIREQSMEEEYPRYVQASYRHQANFIKEGMERARKNPSRAGYSMCAWNDIGPSIRWGILDQFLNPKGISPEDMRVYNAPNVLLFDFVDPDSGRVERVPDYCRLYEQTVTIQPYISWFGLPPVPDATLAWGIETDAGTLLAQGEIGPVTPALYAVTPLPRIAVGPFAPSKPLEATLRMRLSGPGVCLENAWPLWLFPTVRPTDAGRKVFASERVLPALQRVVDGAMLPEDRRSGDADRAALWVTDEGDRASAWLRAGRTVLFLAQGEAEAIVSSAPADAPEAANPFDPGWFKGNGHMGTILREHPLLGDFPHRGYASWQFRHLIRAAANTAGGASATRIVSSVFGDSAPRVRHQLFTANTGAGGHLTYCLLNVLSGRCEADYLLRLLATRARRDAADPVMDEAAAQRVFNTPE